MLPQFFVTSYSQGNSRTVHTQDQNGNVSISSPQKLIWKRINYLDFWDQKYRARARDTLAQKDKVTQLSEHKD